MYILELGVKPAKLKQKGKQYFFIVLGRNLMIHFGDLSCLSLGMCVKYVNKIIMNFDM